MSSVRAIVASTMALLAVCALFAPNVASAQVASVVEPGPIVLDAAGHGSFTLRNAGDAPLHVTTVHARTTEKDPRLPPGVTVAFEGGGTKIDLAPGATRKVEIKWDDKSARARELSGHVVVESNDPRAPQIAVGISAERGGRSAWPLRHLLSTAALVPMLGGLLVAFLALGRRADAAAVRWVALICAAVPCAIAVRLVRAFDGTLGRADGNDGFQSIERTHLAGPFDLSLGVDGLSLPFVALSTGVAFAAVLASGRVERKSEAHLAALLVLSGASTLAFASLDAALFLAALAIAASSLVALLAFAGGERRVRAAVQTGVAMALALGLLAVVLLAFHRQTPADFLADGTRATGFGWSELGRVDLLDRSLAGARLFGVPLVKGALVASLFAFAILSALPPFHGWLGDAIEEAPGAGAAFIAAIVTKLGIYGIARLDVSIVSDGFRWAAPAIAAFAVVSMAWGAVAAAGERDLARIVARLSTAHAGLALLGLAAMTPQGTTGAIVASTAHALSAALVVLVLAHVAHRLETRDASVFAGIAGEAPIAGVALGLGVAGLVLLPASLGMVGALAAVLGVFPTFPVAAVAAAIVLALLAVVTTRAFAPMLFGAFASTWRSSGVLEPHGGRLPDLDLRPILAVVPLAILIVALGLSPAPLTHAIEGFVLGLDARAGSGVR